MSTTLNAIIVDDESLARRGLSLRLQHIPRGGRWLPSAANGGEALQAMAEHSPDLVFLDIQMPGMDGFEVIAPAAARRDADGGVCHRLRRVRGGCVQGSRRGLRAQANRGRPPARGHASAPGNHRAQTESARSKEKLVELVMGMTGASASSIEQMAENPEAKRSYPDRN